MHPLDSARIEVHLAVLHTHLVSLTALTEAIWSRHEHQSIPPLRSQVQWGAILESEFDEFCTALEMCVAWCRRRGYESGTTKWSIISLNITPDSSRTLSSWVDGDARTLFQAKTALLNMVTRAAARVPLHIRNGRDYTRLTSLFPHIHLGSNPTASSTSSESLILLTIAELRTIISALVDCESCHIAASAQLNVHAQGIMPHMTQEQSPTPQADRSRTSAAGNRTRVWCNPLQDRNMTSVQQMLNVDNTDEENRTRSESSRFPQFHDLSSSSDFDSAPPHSLHIPAIPPSAFALPVASVTPGVPNRNPSSVATDAGTPYPAVPCLMPATTASVVYLSPLLQQGCSTLHWDVSTSPESAASSLSTLGCLSPLRRKSKGMKQWATQPPIKRLRITSSSFSDSWAEIHLVQSKALTVFDVLLAIYEHLQVPLGDAECSRISPRQRQLLHCSYYKRCNRQQQSLLQWELCQGIRRVDTFLGQTEIQGGWLALDGVVSHFHLNLAKSEGSSTTPAVAFTPLPSPFLTPYVQLPGTPSIVDRLYSPLLMT